MRAPALLLSSALLSVLLAAPLPAGTAQLPTIQVCGDNAVHTYQGTLSVALGFNGTMFGAGLGSEALDTCPLGTGNPDDFDNDFDAGAGGGKFYASSTCGPAAGSSAAPQMPGYSWSPHHAYAPGSAYLASQAGPGSIVYIVGTDGNISLSQPCLGNDVVSDDPLTDPHDCGKGAVGASPAGPFATIGPNTPGNDCDPASGYVVAFLVYGPVVGCDGTPTESGACIDIDETRNPPVQESITTGNVFISTPTWGTMTG